MGVMDFVKNAGAAVGIGDSIAEEKAKAAEAKAEAEMKAARKAKADAAKKAAAAAKAKQAAAEKERKIKERQATLKEKQAAAEIEKAEALTEHVTKMGIKARGLKIGFKNGVASVSGVVANKAVKERLILSIGNVEGVRQVRDTIKVAPAKKVAATSNSAAARQRRREAAPAQTMHTVKSGDTLSKLAQKYLGDANRYPEIFKANQPMLTDPDMIQVGQVLRIPRK